MDNNKNSFIKGTLLLTISAIILKVIGVIYKIPLSYILGDEGMGYFNSAYTVYTFFYIVGSAGIPKAITILISKNEAESNAYSYAIRKKAMAFFAFISVILCIIFIFFAKRFSNFIANEKSVYSMYAIAPSIVFVSLSGVLRGYYGGKLKFSLMAISEVISGLGKLVIGLLLAYYSQGQNHPLHIISAYTISGITIGTLLSLVFLICFLKRERINIPIRKDFFKTIKSIIKISLPITIASAISGLISILDLTLIMRGLVKNGYSPILSNLLYGNYTTLALPMFTLVATLITQISTALIPTLTRYNALNNNSLFVKEAKKGLKLTYFIIIPSAFLFLFFPYEILSILFDRGSVSLGYFLLTLLAPSILVLGPLTIMNTILEATGKIHYSVLSLTIGALFKLVLNYLLLNFTNLHIFSSPISTLFSYLISLTISYIFIKENKEIKINYIADLMSYIPPTTVMIISGLFVKKFMQKVELTKLETILFLSIMGVVYLILSLLLSKKTRKKLSIFVKTNKKKRHLL